MALAPVLGLAESAALRALTGAKTTMIVAVTTRATRSHTGRVLIAGRSTTATSATMPLLALAAWTAAFLLFLAVYGPMLLAPRPGR